MYFCVCCTMLFYILKGDIMSLYNQLKAEFAKLIINGDVFEGGADNKRFKVLHKAISQIETKGSLSDKLKREVSK